MNKASLSWWLALAVLVNLQLRTPATADDAIPIESPIVCVQLPTGALSDGLAARAGGMLRAEYGVGGRVVRIDPDGQPHVLTDGFAGVCGLDVSFDGRRVLFSARRRAEDHWNIWEMDADGSEVRQITRDLGNCRSPAYQATLYTIVSTEPWYQLMFTSDVAAELSEHGNGAATSLYSCRLDGSGVRRLTMNISDDLDPFLMDDGRVLLSSWQHPQTPPGDVGRISLFGINTDGADYALFCSSQGRRIKHMPCVTSDGLAVFVEADRVEWDGAGQLGSVTLRRSFHSYRPITNDDEAVYHSPSPLADGAVLVSRRTTGGTHGVYRFDPKTAGARLVYDDPGFHELHAKALWPRRQPDGRSSVVNEKYATGVLYCLNAYLGDPQTQPHLQPGMIHELRVIEGVPLSADMEGNPPTDRSHGLGSWVRQRLLGQVPVEADGSFNIEIPADVPVRLQTLDEHGMALRGCGWIWVKHREPRGCIGCHEDPELTPENRFVLAVRRPSMKLTLPDGKRRTVDFRHDVAPIIAAKCGGCHESGADGLYLGNADGYRFSRAYESLLAPGAETKIGLDEPSPRRDKYVHPGRARTSPLIWRVYGRNTARPWDAEYDPRAEVAICPPGDAEPLTADEKRTLVEWVDLGAAWDNVPRTDTKNADPTPGADEVKE